MVDLEEIRKRVEKATPGEWYAESGGAIYASGGDEDGDVCIAEMDADFAGPGDADFIAHARTDIPALLAALDAKTAEVERLTAKYDATIAQQVLDHKEHCRIEDDLKRQLAEASKLVNFVHDEYANQDLSHEEFRIRAFLNTQEIKHECR